MAEVSELKDLPYYKMYPADAETDENFRSMTDAEKGFYWRCLNHCWLNGSLPADSTERARVLQNAKAYAEKMWLRVGRCFSPSSDPARLVNKRQEEERKKAVLKSGKCSDAVRSRYGRITNDLPRAVERTDSDFVPGSECVSPEEGLGETEPSRRVAGAAYRDFIDLWQMPCVCCGMQFSMRDEILGGRVWFSLVDQGKITTANLAEITAGLERYRASTDWHKDGGKYVPSVASWLGWSKNGLPADPRWRDRPTPHLKRATGEGY